MKFKIQNIVTTMVILLALIFISASTFSVEKFQIEYFGRTDCKN